jgi:hypothetical protein
MKRLIGNHFTVGPSAHPNWVRGRCTQERDGEATLSRRAGHSLWNPLQRRLREAGIPISASRVAELAQTTYEMICTSPNAPQRRRLLLPMDDEQRQVYKLQD